MKKTKRTIIETNDSQRRLSPWRVLLGIVSLLSIIGGSVFAWNYWQQLQEAAAHKPWFAPYVDVTAKPTYAFEQLGETEMPYAMLSFIVASPTDACVPTWGSFYELDEARGALDLDRRIARLRQQGGDIAISFGGLLNQELAVSCTEDQALREAYQLVIDRYDVAVIDFDLEGEGLANIDAVKRRASVLASLQKQRRAAGKPIAIWLTLPVSPKGLSQEGTQAITAMLAAKVDLAGINVMTMDYGESRNSGDSMQHASEKALQETHRQLGILYKQQGITLSDTTLWRKIGATPMIGQNDIPGEIFSLDDAKGFNHFVLDQGVGRVSMWSANRDLQCGENYVDVTVVSDSCSGVKQDKLSYSLTLNNGISGDMVKHAVLVTRNESTASIQEKDDPENSPYQIWKESGAYLQGTKVVWHRNVYQAKWWTQGDMPDNPVLQSWETPWQLIGPVLPGEKPIPQVTLPSGTYPVWSGTDTYEEGQRVLFNGVAYQAKWWTQGDSPAAASANFDSSPWAPLTQKQVEDLLQK